MIMVRSGVGDGDGGAMVGLGVAGMSVGDSVADGVGAGVGGGAEGDAVGGGRLAEGVPETAGLGLVAGALHAATKPMTRSAATG